MIINCTPHSLTILRDGEDDLLLAPSGQVPRVFTLSGGLATLVDGVAIHRPDQVGEVMGLPEAQDGVLLVVSGMVAAAVAATMPNRTDVVCPGTSPADSPVRNEKGHIVAVRCLKRAV